MSTQVPSRAHPLEAISPHVLRVNQSSDADESFVEKALRTGDAGFLHSFTTGSTVDGPGVRVVAWTTGCMWRCLYCCNPDTWPIVNGQAASVERVVDELRKYRVELQIMSGGFTVTGGEPLMQDRFVLKLFTAAKAMGIHTALDTNGHLGARLSDQDLETIDLVMMSIKAWDPERHRHLTGGEVGPTLDFARHLAARKRPMWVRFCLVPGLTDDKENIVPIAKFAASLGNVERVEVQPFHQLGRYKWKELGLHYTLPTVVPPSPDRVEWAHGLFRAEGLQVV